MADIDVLKVVLFGDASVGKTSLIRRYAEGVFEDPYFCTMGIDLHSKQIDLNGKTVRLQILDTAGQERFRAIPSAYYKFAHGIMVCYDLTSQRTFESCEQILNDIRKLASESVNLILVGNKCDCEPLRQVSFEDARCFAESRCMLFHESSAKDDINVDEAFHEMAAAILARISPAPVIFTLVSSISTWVSTRISIGKLSGEVLDIELPGPKPTVEAACLAIASKCGLDIKAVKLVTSDGILLVMSEVVPTTSEESRHAAGDDAGSSLRCTVQ